MVIGCISYCFKDDTVTTVAQRLREIGYENIELWFGHPGRLADYREQDAKGAAQTRKRLESAGVTPQAYCIGGFGENHLPVMERAFQYADGLGVDVVTGCATPSIMGRIDALCEQYGKRFAIENHWGNVYESPEDYAETFATTSSRVGVNFDSGHFALAGVDTIQAARQFAGRIYHVHLKDVRTEGDHHTTCAFGKGTAQIAGLIAELKRQEYSGHLSVEHEIEADPTTELKECLEFCLQHA